MGCIGWAAFAIGVIRLLVQVPVRSRVDQRKFVDLTRLLDERVNVRPGRIVSIPPLAAKIVRIILLNQACKAKSVSRSFRQ
jgi:hypothetical protein